LDTETGKGLGYLKGASDTGLGDAIWRHTRNIATVEFDLTFVAVKSGDEIIYRVAGIYDSPGDERDVEKAYEYYLLLTEEYQDSRHYEAARKRVQFFESHFYDYQ
jgi:hypothetical protein